jgi:hypothetical protein
VARPRVTWSGRKKGRGIPPGVKAAALADQLAGGRTLADTARSYGIDVLTVRRLAESVSGIDPEAVLRIQRGLPQLFALLAAGHANEALTRVTSDPAMAVKSTFGAKLAVEAGRLIGASADSEGRTMLELIKALNEAGGGSVTVAVDAPRGPVIGVAADVVDIQADPLDEPPILPPAESDAPTP